MNESAPLIFKRVLCGTLAMGALVSACASPPGTGAPTPPGGPEAIANCAVREISRQRLTVEGNRPLYVEADAFVANGRGEVLLAGTPNYLWQISTGGEITGLTEDSIFGAVIGPNGIARAVPAPIPARQIHGIRVAARDDHGWDVVFTEVAPYTGDNQPNEALRLWYGVYNGQGWNSLEQIPAPNGILLSTLFSSALVRRGDSLAWALATTIHSARKDIVLVQRREGRWSYEFVPTGSGADVDLSYSDSLGLLLAVVQADRTLMSDGNSLLLWAQRPEWRILRRVVHGYGEGRVYDPAFLRLPAGLLATWRTPVGNGRDTRQELRATAGRLEQQSEPVVVLDPNVSIWSWISPFVLSGGAPVWVAHPVAPENTAGELRVVSIAGDSAVELGRLVNPYGVRVAAAAVSSAELLVTGMEYSENRYAFSLLLRTRIECRAAP